MGRPRKPPGQRLDRYRKYEDEPDYRPPRPRGKPRTSRHGVAGAAAGNANGTARRRRYEDEPDYRPPRPRGGSQVPARAGYGTAAGNANGTARHRRAPSFSFPSLGPGIWTWVNSRGPSPLATSVKDDQCFAEAMKKTLMLIGLSVVCLIPLVAGIIVLVRGRDIGFAKPMALFALAPYFTSSSDSSLPGGSPRTHSVRSTESQHRSPTTNSRRFTRN
jgi:hypothetical protein